MPSPDTVVSKFSLVSSSVATICPFRVFSDLPGSTIPVGPAFPGPGRPRTDCGTRRMPQRGAGVPEPMTDVIADRYALVDPIGAGGSGTVWRAFDRRRDAFCAAKLLRRRDAGELLRFRPRPVGAAGPSAHRQPIQLGRRGRHRAD